MLCPVENRHRQKLHRESRLRLSPRNLPPRRPNPLKRQPLRSPRSLRSKPSEAMDSRVTRWSLLCAHSARFVSRSDQYANDRDGSFSTFSRPRLHLGVCPQLPLKADVNTAMQRQSRSAISGREQMQQMTCANARYSITSSARNSIDVGNTIPNLFAVFRFTTSSNFVGNSAGTSPGFEPRSTLATIGAL